jgi:hypothetical protein
MEEWTMAKADRIPKKIAGLKLPKSIREAPAVRSLLSTAKGRKIFAEALIEGAATAAAQVIKAHEAAKAEKPAVPGKTKRSAKPAPGAAPANDVTPVAPQTLISTSSAKRDPANDIDFEDPAKPGASD